MNEFKLEEKLLITDLKTVSFLLDQGADVLALYFFYYKTAKQQKTNQVWATRSFILKALRWGPKRFKKAQDVLKKYNLVEVVKGNKANDKWYVKINYLTSKEYQNALVQSDPKKYQNELVHSDTGKCLKEDISINAYTSTNVDGGSAKSQPSCPLLNGSPLRGKYPNGHTECVDYLISIEMRRGFKFINRDKQFKCIHSTLRSGFDFEAMNKTVPVMEKIYGRGNWDFTTMASFLEKGSANA